MKRPKELAGREFLTDAEVAEFMRRAKRLFKDQDGDYPVGDNLFMAVLANPEHYTNPNVLEGSAELIGAFAHLRAIHCHPQRGIGNVA